MVEGRRCAGVPEQSTAGLAVARLPRAARKGDDVARARTWRASFPRDVA